MYIIIECFLETIREIAFFEFFRKAVMLYSLGPIDVKKLYLLILLTATSCI